MSTNDYCLCILGANIYDVRSVAEFWLTLALLIVAVDVFFFLLAFTAWWRIQLRFASGGWYNSQGQFITAVYINLHFPFLV